MKNIFLLVAAFIVLTTAYGQNTKLVIKFAGKIEDPNYNSVAIVNDNGFKKIFELSAENDFSDTLTIPNKGMYTFSDGRESTVIYLAKDCDIYLTLNTKEFDESIKYTGKGSGNNNFLAQKYLINEREIGDGYALYGADEKAFLEKQKNVDKQYFDLLKELKDQEFIDYQSKEILYNSFLAISSYKTYHRYITKDMSFEISQEFLKPLLSLDFNNETDYVNFKSYKQLVNANYLRGINDKNKIEQTLKNVCAIKSDKIKNGVINEILSSKLDVSNENVTLLYNTFIKVCNDKFYTDEFTSRYNVIKKLLKGQPSPKFAFKDVNDKLVKLDDLKGKYVYIDVWATWCSPCLGEIPYLKKLEEDYHEKNIAFVSISVDNLKAYDKWKQMVADKNLKGYQLFADKSWQSDFVQGYKIMGIPTFILIDTNGNIVSASAMRPSNPELRALFDSLLK